MRGRSFFSMVSFSRLGCPSFEKLMRSQTRHGMPSTEFTLLVRPKARWRYGGKFRLGPMRKRKGAFTPLTPKGIPLLPFATALATAAACAAASSAWDSGVRVGAQGAHTGFLATPQSPPSSAAPAAVTGRSAHHTSRYGEGEQELQRGFVCRFSGTLVIR
jgi:hypothetical protein